VSKKRKKQPRPQGGGSGNGVAPTNTGKPLRTPNAYDAAEIQALNSAALAIATDDDVAAALEAKPDETAPFSKLRREAAEAQRIYRNALERLETDRKLTEELRRQLNSEQDDLRGQREKFDKESETLLRQKSRQLEREAELTAREQDALGDFAERKWTFLEQLRRQERELEGRLASLAADLSVQQSALERERAEHLERLRGELGRIRSENDAAVAEEHRLLREERTKTAAERQAASLDREQLEEDKKLLEQRVAQTVTRRVQAIVAERDDLARRAQELEQQLAELRGRITNVERAEQRFGGRDPRAVLEEISKLRAENGRLHDELATRPTLAERQRLAELESGERRWVEDRARLQQRVAELENQQAGLATAEWQVTALRTQHEELQSVLRLQEERLARLKKEIDDNLRKVTDSNPFRAFREFDEDESLQQRGPTVPVTDLSRLITWVRQRILAVSEDDNPLYYRDEDLRLFLAGMAMSPLILLQGVSGTGKTSLPIHFARAIGAGELRHPVEAGWRDINDLVGHFNSFEGRFYATNFLKALYKAQTPAHANRPFFIVLDEINLSSPEQYFAKFLSEMEEPNPARRQLALLDEQFANGPKLLVDGNTIRIPDNVWFVGTANHDETTLGFAPKTYDRAHVMELRQRAAPFAKQAWKLKDPLSFSGLQEAFDRAAIENAAACNGLLAMLEGRLKSEMHRNFRIGWGPRLDRQIKRFVPVMIAAGGSVAEAADHILTTKVLRPIRHRHDNRPEHLDTLTRLLREEWVAVDGRGRPDRSLALIEEERADRVGDAVRDEIDVS
jgi:hypothetical protein